MGLPILIVTLFLSLGIIFPLGISSKVPFILRGTTGTLAHNASLAAPVLPLCSFPVKLLVPSGNIPIISPSFRAFKAFF